MNNISALNEYINNVTETICNMEYANGVSISLNGHSKEIFLAAVTVAEFLELAGDAPITKRDRESDVWPVEISFMQNGVKVFTICDEEELNNGKE